MFVHLHVHSPFSFLDGAARIEQLVEAAASFGMPALAITDHNGLSGAVRFHRAATAAGIAPIIGAEVTLEGGNHLTLLAQNPLGYANLCRLLTEAHLSQPRLQPAASFESLARCNEGLIALSGCDRGELPSLIRHRRYPEAKQAALRYLEVFGRDRFFLEMQQLGLPGGGRLCMDLAALAEHLSVGVVATNNVHYLRPEHFPLHDVLTCVRTLTTLDEVHPERGMNAQAYLRSPEEMQQAFTRHPSALATAMEIASRCEPALIPGGYRFPEYPDASGEEAAQMLERLTMQGAKQRYRPLTGAVRQRLRHELSVIRQLRYENYFLAVWDLLQFARLKGIRYAGRGSAADSAVAYCLGITRVDPVARGLLFERFMSLERAAPPDIDIDFEAEKRDDVTEFVTKRYGQEHVATVATYSTFRARSAVRDLGKAVGLAPADIDALAKRLPYMSAESIEGALDRVPELRESHLPKERYRFLLDLCRQAAGFPRHLSTHLGGIIIGADPITAISPLQMAAKGVAVIQFDKDDVEDLGLAKLDLLCLRMLSAEEQSARSVKARDPSFEYDSIPHGDKATYDLIASTETAGMFQLESPAQRALHARLQPDDFEDLVASVALIRPGPLQADMVSPYLDRRLGREPVTYLHPALERILAKTYGVVLFQEQVIEIATAIAGFTAGEADQLRRTMTHHRSAEEMGRIGERFMEKAVARGIREEVAKEVFSYIRAYAGYGFCEAHAAAFADTAYKSAYLIAHYPADFYASLLSCQPMGFYPPNTLIWEAKRRGIRILPPDVNQSEARYTVEEGAIRVGLAQVHGMGEESLKGLIEGRQHGGPFTSLPDLARRAGASQDVLRNLILCGACDSICRNRREGLWQCDADARDRGDGPQLDLDAQPHQGVSDFTPGEKWRQEFAVLGVALNRHPVELSRARLRTEGVITVAAAKQGRSGQRAKVAGVVIRPHRPPTRSGRTVVFFTLEDETGLLDVTMFERVYHRCGAAVFTRPVITVTGRLDRRGHASAPAALVVEQVS